MNKTSFYKQLKKKGPTGLVIGLFALLLCELPIVLALLGLGSIVSIESLTNVSSSSFGLHAVVYIVVILASVILITKFIKRMWKQHKPDVE